MKKYSVVIPEHIHRKLCVHLIRSDEQEDLCFATYVPSSGKNRYTGIISDIILPQDEERSVHGNAEFYSSYLLRALEIANKEKKGLIFLHSHPFFGWQGMSLPDVIAEKRIASTAFAMTNLPLLGLTVGNDQSWSARFWIKDLEKKRTYNREWCESVRVIGKKLTITFNDHLKKTKINQQSHIRTIAAWGIKTQNDISRLKIGIVGLGSVGSNVAENLSRTGITDFVLIDFDTLEEKNLDRTLGASTRQIGLAKVKVIEEAIRASSSVKEIDINSVEYSICEEKGFKSAIDCDVLFSCVDRPWPRQVLNFISYAHLIPVIDGGVYVRTNANNTKLMNATLRAHTIGYSRTCMECIEQFNSALAKVESEGLLENPRYIDGMTDKSFLNSENVFAFSSYVASMEVMQFFALFVAPSGTSDIGQHIYQMSLGVLEKDNKTCHPKCFYQTITGKGDKAEIQLVGKHEIAELKREERDLKFKNAS